MWACLHPPEWWDKPKVYLKISFFLIFLICFELNARCSGCVQFLGCGCWRYCPRNPPWTSQLTLILSDHSLSHLFIFSFLSPCISFSFPLPQHSCPFKIKSFLTEQTLHWLIRTNRQQKGKKIIKWNKCPECCKNKMQQKKWSTAILEPF